ncbi:exostosin-1 [Sarcoptes scabiei]|nr:exostosin-1 [Sarcoptes scabiei]
MKFHELHGINVVLDETRRIANRINSFCDAFVLSSQPLRQNFSIVIKLSSTILLNESNKQCSQTTNWLGNCFLGLTSKNPSSFIESIYPKHLINLLANKSEDVWIKQIDTNWSDASLILNLNSDGQLEIVTEFDPEIRYIFLDGLPVNFPLWLVFDLYGRTNQIQFPHYTASNSPEIVSLGSDVYSTFKCGENGIVPYNSGRIILIGPKNSGKSQLKNMLFNRNSLDLKNSTKNANNNIKLNQQEEWTLISRHRFPNKIHMSSPNLSDIYHELSRNIVMEIISIHQEQLESNSLSPKDMIRNVLRLPRKLLRPYSKEMKEFSENLNEIPEELMFMIEEQLKRVPNEIKNENTFNRFEEHSSMDLIERKNLINISDFDGDLMYLIINQFFFTNSAVYLLVINLADNLDATNLCKQDNYSYISELGSERLTVLHLLHLWFALIHCTVAGFNLPNDCENEETEKFDLQPQIVLVGTHRNSVHAEPITRNQIIEEIFEKIQSSLAETSYSGHLFKNKIAIDCQEMSFDEPEIVSKLKKIIQSLFKKEKLSGFNIPLCWMQLEQILEKFKQKGIYFVDINQLHEVVSSQIDSFRSYENLNAALSFYHNQGRIFYLDCVNQNMVSNENQGPYEFGIIILDPKWFIHCVYDLCSYLCKTNENEEKLDDEDNQSLGIISENSINNAWIQYIDQKFILLGCLENLDLIYELSPYLPMEDASDIATTTIFPKLYFFPWITKPIGEFQEFNDANENGDGRSHSSKRPNESNTTNSQDFGESTFQFVIKFDILPVSLFTRLMIRLSKWSWNQGWGRKPEMINAKGRIAVDFDHDIILKVNIFQARIYLIIVKIFEEIPNDQIENLLLGPTANVCVKVKNLMENELSLLKHSYYRRLNFKLVVPCPCDAICDKHKLEGCIDEVCLHFLTLQECLQKKLVECQYNRQVRTTFIQRFLPYVPTVNNDFFYESMFTMASSTNVWENIFQIEQQWMREAAKLLNKGSQKSSPDWISLAKRLSYSERDIIKFSTEISPALALLKDWYESNGRTRYCIDVLISCLRILSRDDIVALIEYELEPENVSPSIFLSYQHDSQKQVLEIRKKLELSGFPCWMDTKSLGAGDSLYGKIYEGISRAKVFICCLTPRYVASPMCNREVALADVLHKPILPIIIEFVPWPPPGAMALIMSSIVYVDLCGVGSHSGTGHSQDTESRFREIFDHIGRYISGYCDNSLLSSRYLQLPDLFKSQATINKTNPRQRAKSDKYGHRNHGAHFNIFLRQSNQQNYHNLIDYQNQTLQDHYNQLSRNFDNNHQRLSSSSMLSLIRRSDTSESQFPTVLIENDLDRIIRETDSNVNNEIIENELDGSNDIVGDDSQLNNNGNINGNQNSIGSRSQSETNENGQSLREDIPFVDEMITDDNISVITRTRIANRITNCAVCLIN